MNYLVGVALVIILFFVSKKLFASLIFVSAQVIGNAIIDKIGLNRLSILNWDIELSNIIIIVATLTIGPGFALLIGLATVGYHAFHEEVVDIHSMIDYSLRAAIIVGVIAVVPGAIPWAILFSKIPVIFLNKFLWGSHLWGVYNWKEIFSVAVYFIIF